MASKYGDFTYNVLTTFTVDLGLLNMNECASWQPRGYFYSLKWCSSAMFVADTLKV